MFKQRVKHTSILPGLAIVVTAISSYFIPQYSFVRLVSQAPLKLSELENPHYVHQIAKLFRQ